MANWCVDITVRRWGRLNYIFNLTGMKRGADTTLIDESVAANTVGNASNFWSSSPNAQNSNNAWNVNFNNGNSNNNNRTNTNRVRLVRGGE
jgi:hypothetical protein